MSEFRAVTSGKWILAGEHSVLRGVPALVFPLASRPLEISYSPGSRGSDLTLRLSGNHGEELQLLFWGVLEKACELRKMRRGDFSGQVQLSSSIPVGAGLGASAALCVAVSRWLAHLKVISEAELSEFSRQLENLFHGESSGVDIAVALGQRPLEYRRGQSSTELRIDWQPRLYLSYSGQRGVTVECVNKVKRLFESNPRVAAEIDERMRMAVGLCQEALALDADRGFATLQNAIELAGSCFADWQLIEGTPLRHLQMLRDKGARAVKPTGSGQGGYALSLWDQSPPAELRDQLIPCFV